MRALKMVVLLLLLAGPIGAEVVSYRFDDGLDGFVKLSGQGAVAHDTAAPLTGTASLRLDLAEGARELRVASPEFAVKPWTLYRLKVRQRADRGAQLVVGVQLDHGDGWRDASVFQGGEERLFGTLPDSSRARLLLTLRVPGQALGRSVTVDDVTLEECAPLVGEKGVNLYWDGSFEQSLYDWSFWVHRPEKMVLSSSAPHGGRQCLHIETQENTYIVFPSVPVRPRRLYRLQYWVRGKGVIHPGLHKLAPKDWQSMRIDTARRVGRAHPIAGSVELREDAWQRVEIITPCESDRIVWFQPYFSLRQGSVDVDSVELRSVPSEERTQPQSGNVTR